MMEYDKLRIEYRASIQHEPLIRYIFPSLWVNDQCLSEGLVVDMRILAASMKGPGEYDILTCSCGEPGCAGVWQGIIVFHYYDLIRWLIPHPIVRPFEPDGKEAERVITFKDRYFRKTDYVKAIVSAIEEAKGLILQNPDSARTVPLGFSVRELLNLEAP